MGIKEASGKSIITTSFKARAGRFHSMSKTFIEIVSYNTKKAKQIESSFQKNNSNKKDYFIKHRSYVIGVIFSSVAFLESTINQLFWDCLKNPKRYTNLTDKHKKIMGTFWQEINSNKINQFKDDTKTKEELKNILLSRQDNQDKYHDTNKNLKKISNQIDEGRITSPILINKYQFALFINDKELFAGHNSDVFRNINLVIDLRNNITHYVPNINNKKIQKMEEKLKNARFQVNPLVSDSSIFFPHKCLGSGCAEWAYQSCIDFVNDFYNRMGFPFDDFKKEFKEWDKLSDEALNQFEKKL